MKLFQKDELRLLWPFYLEDLISNVFLLYPIYWIIQFQETLLLSQIGLIISSVSIANFLFEVPTGAVADIFGRKFSVIFGLFLTGIMFLSITFTKNFYYLLILFFLLGISVTLISGADVSWVADNLKYKKKKKLLQTYFVKKMSIMRFSFMFAGLIGGIIVKYYGLNIIWPVTAFSLLVSCIILFFAEEHKLTKEQDKSLKSVYNQTFKSLKYSLKHKTLFSYILICILTGFVLSFAGDLIWKPYLVEFNIPNSYFGYLFSIGTALGIIAPFAGSYLAKKLNKEKTFFSLILAFETLFLILAIFAGNWVVLAIIMLLFVFLFDMFDPIQKNYIQKLLPSDKRATLSSFFTMFLSLGMIIGGPLGGLTADYYGFRITLFIGVLFFIPMIYLYRN
ncbi:MFS transporter [Candidatus Woesearchaeota archaeon]|nr:MFS transporter [Candidatus Woesearchaeota archaeon]